VLDLKANPDRIADGVVIEAKLDKGRGAVSTVLVKRGTLKRGDIVVAGSQFGRVRALLNERNEQLTEAGPATPVEILGLDGVPVARRPLRGRRERGPARELTEYRIRLKREKSMHPVGAGATSMADMMAKLQDKKYRELPLVIKADVQGSAEAIIGSLDAMSTDEVRARIILSGAGAISESDVMLAKGAGAPLIGFNVRASAQARALAEREGVEIRYYAIIYDLLDDIKGVLSGMLAPIQRETFLGNAEVLQAFDISKVGKIAGCRVTEGVVRKGAKVRIIRDDIVVLELGTLQTLKRFKDEVNEVPSGQECGMISPASRTSRSATPSSASPSKRSSARSKRWALRARANARLAEPRCLSAAWVRIERTTRRPERGGGFTAPLPPHSPGMKLSCIVP
jgi:translation initiation factor IF-2